MQKFDELISYFNRKVSDMDIDRHYKMELLGMVTALGYAHEKETEERKTGRWIDKSDGLIEGAWNYCSVCGEQAIDLYDYCPNCGARMEDTTNG